MANTSVEIQKMIFDISDPQITKVTIEIEHDDPGILLKKRFEKTFPARIPITEMFDGKSPHFIFGGENHYLTW